MKEIVTWSVILYTMTLLSSLTEGNNMLISCYSVKGVDLFQSNPEETGMNTEFRKEQKKSKRAQW